jgi:transketolase
MTPPDYDDLRERLRRNPNDWQNPQQDLLDKAANALEFQRGMIEQADRQIADYRERAEKAEADNAALREALIDVLASLVAAHSLLEGGGKKAAASDKMFYQMLKDYAASIARGRAALLAGKEP